MSAATSLPLDQPLSIADLARHCKVSTERMRYGLFRLHAKHEAEGGVLIRVGSRWMVPSLHRLQKYWPDLGKKFFAAEDVEKTVDEVKELRRDLRATQARLRLAEASIERLTALVTKMAAQQQSRSLKKDDEYDLADALVAASRSLG